MFDLFVLVPVILVFTRYASRVALPTWVAAALGIVLWFAGGGLWSLVVLSGENLGMISEDSAYFFRTWLGSAMSAAAVAIGAAVLYSREKARLDALHEDPLGAARKRDLVSSAPPPRGPPPRAPRGR